MVRPGSIVNSRHFDPPGRLGRRLGSLFLAVGSPNDRVAVVERDFAARTLAWLATHFAEAPHTLHLVAPVPATKGDLVMQLRQTDPDLTIVWLPRVVLLPLSWLARALQKALHPRQAATNLAPAFAPQQVDPGRIRALAPIVLGDSARDNGAATPRGTLSEPGAGPRPRPPARQRSFLVPRTGGE